MFALLFNCCHTDLTELPEVTLTAQKSCMQGQSSLSKVSVHPVPFTVLIIIIFLFVFIYIDVGADIYRYTYIFIDVQICASSAEWNHDLPTLTGQKAALKRKEDSGFLETMSGSHIIGEKQVRCFSHLYGYSIHE